MTSETPSVPATPLTLTFHGTAREYFRVWLPGACLTWLTLGLYSAWAAVRRTRYLLVHTELGGLPFGYQARPWPLLFGRACLWLALGLGWFTFRFPDVGLWILAGYACVLPFVLVRVARFVARSRTYRGEPGEFTGSARSFFFVATPALMSAALGALAVYARLHLPLYRFWAAHPSLFTLLYTALFLGVLVALQTAVRNVVAKHTRWGGLSFDSRCELGPMLWLHLTNGLASLLSLGLLIPWAEIRAQRYRLRCLRVLEGGA